MNNTSIAIMGGTFDPIHIGHLETAKAVCEKMGFERVIFMPAFMPPHKLNTQGATAEERFAMVELACNHHPIFEPSNLEILKGGLSYTYDSILEIKKNHPNKKVYYIIGADTLPLLKAWHEIGGLLNEMTFIVATRPGYLNRKIEFLDDLKALAKEKIIFLDTPEFDVSSTRIRELLAEGKSIKGLVTPAVEEYIIKHKLYSKN